MCHIENNSIYNQQEKDFMPMVFSTLHETPVPAGGCQEVSLQVINFDIVITGANLIVADYNRLYLINLNETTVTKLVVGIQTAGQDTIIIDYHRTKSYIFWLDSYYGYIHR